MENLDTFLVDFEAVLDDNITKSWDIESQVEHMEALVKAAQVLSEKIVAIGDKHYTVLLENEHGKSDNLFDHYFINYVWADAAKSFLLLWRDILFQNQRAYFLNIDGDVTAENISVLHLQSKNVIAAASSDFKKLFQEEQKRHSTPKKAIAKQISRWKLQQNPWPLYRVQIQELARQGLELKTYFEIIKKVAGGFQDTRKLIEESTTNCRENITSFKSTGNTAYEMIKDSIESGKELRPGKIAAKLEDLDAQLNVPDYLKIFNDSLDEILDSMPHKTSVPIDTNGGIIFLREINFNRAVKQWIESEIMPVMYEIWELTENAQNSLKMSLFNVQNRMVVLSTEMKEKKVQEVKFDDFNHFLKNFSNKLSGAEEGLSSLQKIINNRLENDFKLTGFYQTEDEFLALPLQSTVSRFKLSNIRFLDKVKFWLSKQLGVVRQFQKAVEKEAALSPSEKIMRFIKCRQPDAENQYYSSIFLTKGFIGETFWIGRESEIKHIESVINYWKEGFRGAVAITGQRLSGKSLFGHFVANRFFRNQSVMLAPNSALNVNGRRMDTGFDLEEALSFIKKNTINQPLLVWIDDLELWSHPHFPVSLNVQKLLKFMDENPENIFFLVSMSRWFKAYLNRFFDVKRAFQAEINMDKMSFENVQEAILIRHGATHKKLMTSEGHEIDAQQFRKIVKKVYQASEGIIGEALLYWTISIKKLNNDEVTHEWIPNHPFPNFLDSNTGLLLALIMKERKTNEFHLRKLFGPAYNESYAVILQRLLGLGLLSRLPDGMLEVNEMAANELGKMLEQKNFIQFSKQL